LRQEWRPRFHIIYMGRARPAHNTCAQQPTGWRPERGSRPLGANPRANKSDSDGGGGADAKAPKAGIAGQGALRPSEWKSELTLRF
jgi:hypothetical protein